MAGFKGFNTNQSVSRGLPPEERLILAVYIRARNDLFAKSARWREDAELFFEADGLDPKRIRAWFVKRGTPTGLHDARP